MNYDLTKNEQEGVRRALRVLRARYGAKPLAKVLAADIRTLRGVLAGSAPTPALAFRVARLAGVGMDDVLAGRYPGPEVCAHCGHRKEVEAA